MARKGKSPELVWAMGQEAKEEVGRLKGLAGTALLKQNYAMAEKIAHHLESKAELKYGGGPPEAARIRIDIDRATKRQAAQVFSPEGRGYRIMADRGVGANQVDTLKIQDDIIAGLKDPEKPLRPLQVVEQHADKAVRAVRARTVASRVGTEATKRGFNLRGMPMQVDMGAMAKALEGGGIPALNRAVTRAGKSFSMGRGLGRAGAIGGGLAGLYMLAKSIFGDKQKAEPPPMSPEMQMLMMKQMSMLDKDQSLIQSRKMSDMLKYASMMKMMKEMQTSAPVRSVGGII